MIYLNCNGKRGNTKNILMVEMVVGLQILTIKDNVTFKRTISWNKLLPLRKY